MSKDENDVANTVTTTGQATITSAPDFVVVQFRIASHLPDKAGALSDMTERSAVVDRLIANSTDTILQRADSATTLAAVFIRPWDERIPDGYLAQRTTTLRLSTWDRLAELMRAAVEDAEVSLVGPSWGLNPANSAFNQARSRAANDARERGTAYCAGLGVTLGEVRSITDSSSAWTDQLRRDSSDLMFAASSSSSHDDQEDDEERLVLSINPPEIEVNASVTVRFSIKSHH